MQAPSPAPEPTADWAAHPGILRCVACGDGDPRPDAGDPRRWLCDRCGRAYPIRDGVLVVNDHVLGQQQGRQRLLQQPALAQVPVLGVVHLRLQRRRAAVAGQGPAAPPQGPGLKLLDVAVGDGVYLDWLPSDWSVVGVDVSTAQLAACRQRVAAGPPRDVQLILGEAEDLPVRDHQFDAALSIGAFNYFNDPEQALREMVRAVKPGGTIVISDELPNLTDRMIFRKIGLPRVDHWIVSRMMYLGDDFTAMVERHRALDIRAITERVLPGSRYEEIWMKVGYVDRGDRPGADRRSLRYASFAPHPKGLAAPMRFATLIARNMINRSVRTGADGARPFGGDRRRDGPDRDRLGVRAVVHGDLPEQGDRPRGRPGRDQQPAIEQPRRQPRPEDPGGGRGGRRHAEPDGHGVVRGQEPRQRPGQRLGGREPAVQGGPDALGSVAPPRRRAGRHPRPGAGDEPRQDDGGDAVDLAGETFRVVGVFESDSLFENGGLIIPLAELQRMMGRQGQVTGFVVAARSADAADVAQLARRIEAEVPGVAAVPARDYVQGDLQIRLTKTMAWATTAVALVLGSIGLLNTMVMAVFERTGEVGLLRALGWRRRRVLLLILGEALVLGLLGAVVGTALAYLGVRALLVAPTARGFIDPDLPPGVIAIGLALGVGLSLVGGLYPALRASALDPTEALRHD